MRNKAYLKGKAGKESGKEGKDREKGTEHTQREGAGAHHLPPVDTTTATKREPQRKLLHPQNSNIS